VNGHQLLDVKLDKFPLTGMPVMITQRAPITLMELSEEHKKKIKKVWKIK